MYISFKDRVKRAIDLAPHLIVDSDKVNDAEGFPLCDFTRVGLSKSDLKKLHRVGLALLGYKPTSQGWVSRYAFLAKVRP